MEMEIEKEAHILKARHTADNLRNTAKRSLRRLLGIREGESNVEVERIIDAVIGAAVIEVALIQHEMLGPKQESRKDINPPILSIDESVEDALR